MVPASSAGGDPGNTEDGARGGVSLYRLRPNHGVVFLDIELQNDVLASQISCFIEDHAGTASGAPPVLIPLEREAFADGTIWHPRTHAPVAPSDALLIDGRQAVAAFAGTWLPLPVLRVIGRLPGGRLRFDAGPLNWVRLHIEKTDPTVGAGRPLRAVLAFDTRLVTDSRVDLERYVAPTEEDASFGSTFVFSDQTDDIAAFVGDPWIMSWLDGIVKARDTGPSEKLNPAKFLAAPPTGNLRRPKLAHLAHYLVLLKVLKAARAIPQVRFFDALGAGVSQRTEAVDLVVDAGGDDLVAFLVERSRMGASADLGQARPLALRDLSQPEILHAGLIPSHVEFDRQPFGDLRSSRLSGRTDAFMWPTLARIGSEAQRLSQRANATPGVTGLSDVQHYASDDRTPQTVWRISTDHGTADRPGSMASGPALGVIGEDGRPFAAGSGLPAVRTRFTQASLLGFAYAEIITHAISKLAEPVLHQRGMEALALRSLRSLTLALPVSLSREEQETLLARAEDGIDLVWRTMGWDQSNRIDVPQKPKVFATLGGDLGAQLLFIEDEVETRFGGDFYQFAVEAGLGHVQRDLSDVSVRILSVELSRRALASVSADYRVEGSGAIHPNLRHAVRVQGGTGSVGEAVIRDVILPSIKAGLATVGLGWSQEFLSAIAICRNGTADDSVIQSAGRLRAKILEPAAEALLALAAKRPFDLLRGTENVSLERLAILGGGRLSDEWAMMTVPEEPKAAPGGFDLGRIQIAFNQGHLGKVIETALNSLMEALAERIDVEQHSFVLITGQDVLAPALKAAVLQAFDMSPHRVVLFGERRNTLIESMTSLPDVGHSVLAGAASAILASSSHANPTDLLRGAIQINSGQDRATPPSEQSRAGASLVQRGSVP